MMESFVFRFFLYIYMDGKLQLDDVETQNLASPGQYFGNA